MWIKFSAPHSFLRGVLLGEIALEATHCHSSGVGRENGHLLNRQICEESESLAEEFIKLVTDPLGRIQTLPAGKSARSFRRIPPLELWKS